MQSRLDRLFLHFFDTHFIADKGRAADSEAFRFEMKVATRLAIASADKVYIPAASFFESSLCRGILSELGELIELGIIALAGNAVNLDEYIKERQDETFYRRGSQQHDWYRAHEDAATNLPYVRRMRSATRDLGAHWNQQVMDQSLARKLRDASDQPIAVIESRLERVPEELGSLAFIPDHVFEILDVKEGEKLIRARIRSAINEGYFESYTKDLRAGTVIDLNHLASDFVVPSHGRDLSYNRMLRFLRGRDRLRELANCDVARLLQLGADPDWRIALTTSVTYVPSSIPTAGASPGLGSSPQHDQGHGHFTKRNSMNSSNDSDAVAGQPECVVLCIAAAATEFATVRAKLSEDFGRYERVFIDEGRLNYALKFVDPKSDAVWYVAGQSFQGQVDAALTITAFEPVVKPTMTLMIGMCMGMPRRALAVGTVIVPNEVIAFDHLRLTKEGTEYRPHGDRVDTGLYRLARTMEAHGSSYKVVDDKALASASAKIENPNAELVKKIEAAFPDAAAFDMESSGFYRSVKGDCLLIKAVADSAESQASDANAREAKQSTQSVATANALHFAVSLVREYMSAKSFGAK